VTVSPTDRAEIAEHIIAWFAQNKRELPWRSADASPWHILVSEFMLQQTQVERVLPRYLEWISRWPTPRDLAAASPAEALQLWGRLGYPRRALWLHRAATEIATRFNNRVPHDPEQLEKLTGIGPYTARAVSSFAFGHRHPVVDTNTRRVLARAIGGRAAAGNPSRSDLSDQAALLPEDPQAATELNAGTMELGALICTARAPRCGACPIAQWCQWRGAGFPDNAPKKVKPQAKFSGSDRQARGKVMELLREQPNGASRFELIEAASKDKQQGQRAVDSLVRDGLVVELAEDELALPSSSD
jgi:A/G-specific adenine glycosylase